MHRHTRLIIWLLVINIVLRGAWLIYMHPPQSADFELYLVRAGQMAAGHGYAASGKYTAYWPIGWPYILSVLFRFIGGPSLTAGLILNTLLSIGIVLLVYALAVRLTRSSRIAFAAALGYSLLPSQIQWNAVLGSEESFTFLVLLSLLLYVYANRAHWVFRTAIAGVILGLACDVRPIPLLFPILVFVYEWWPRRRAIGQALCRAATYAVGMLLGIMPVTIRNYITMHHLILVSTNGGVNLWQGMYTNSGYYWRWVHNPLLSYGPYNEITQNKIGEQVFFQHLLHHPFTVLHMGIYKVISLYNDDVNANWYTFHADHMYTAAHIFNYIDTALYGVMMLIALVGLVRLFRGRIVSWRVMALILAFILYYSTVFLVFPAWDRFRYPLMPLYAILLGLAFAKRRGESAYPEVGAIAVDPAPRE